MPSGVVHHIDLVVSSIERSLPFYRGLLGPLGWGTTEEEADRGERVWYLWQRPVSIALREARASGGVRGLVVDFRRWSRRARLIALEVNSREVVDERFRWLVQHEVEVANEPHAYGYGSRRYGVSFHDPDGMNLELVHVGEQA
jgi:catechol 2,3-dioxygenase-like lactoylglutathione lyase family enzyme